MKIWIQKHGIHKYEKNELFLATLGNLGLSRQKYESLILQSLSPFC